MFEEWKKSYPADADAENRFCQDGLIIKYREGYDVNMKWKESQRKIMFLLKDCPDEWTYDTRRLLTGYEDKEDSMIQAQNTRNLKSPRKGGRGDTGFFRNIATILHGCMRTLRTGCQMRTNGQRQAADPQSPLLGA